MPLDRRRFLQLGAALAGAAALAPAWALGPTLAGPTSRPLKILVLGGTRYLGPAVVEAALSRGHAVTLFNRGKTAPDLFPGVTRLRGNRYPDRDGGMTALESGRWDLTIDLCAYYPRLVEASTRLLADRTDRYLMVSSVSVFRDLKTEGPDETAATLPLAEAFEELPDLYENDWKTYGGRKAANEAIVQRVFGARATILRPCSICGGGNNDGSGAYWAARLQRGGRVLLPGDGSDPTQLIDVRDVADFAVLAGERKLAGVYNVAGPAERLSLRDYIAAAGRVVGSRAEVVWKGDFPRAMYGLPLAPPYAAVPGFATASNAKARAAGLRFRAIEETIRSNWLDHRARRGDAFDFAAAGIGLGADQEAALLAGAEKRTATR